MSYDVLVVGAGPGGYVAAIRAAQVGLRAALVERAHLGGVCLNWGCIPTKSMLKGVEAQRVVQAVAKWGHEVGPFMLDPVKLVSRSRETANQLAGGVAYLLRKNKVDLIWGEAFVGAPGEVQVSASASPAPMGALGPGRYGAKAIILATGASPRRLPGLEPDGRLVWSYYEALMPRSVPASLVIVGSGAIGVEFATIYAALGSAVRLVEAQPRVLPLEDAEISEAMAKALRKRGITIHVGTTVTALDGGSDRATVTLSDGGCITAEAVLAATGVVPNIGGLGLEALGVELRNGVVATDHAGRTNVPGLFAIGDLAGPPMLAHKAEHDGVRCVETIAGRPSRPGDHAVPSCIFADPQVASIGLTESAAAARGRPIRIGRFGFRGNGKAVVLGETDGFVKTIFDAETDRLIGAHMIGPDVSELLHGMSIAMKLGATARDLVETVFPHPTLSEALHEAALAAGEGAIHA